MTKVYVGYEVYTTDRFEKCHARVSGGGDEWTRRLWRRLEVRGRGFGVGRRRGFARAGGLAGRGPPLLQRAAGGFVDRIACVDLVYFAHGDRERQGAAAEDCGLP